MDEARKVLKDGLEKANEKYLLCNILGEVEWKARNIKQTVFWWCQGLLGQESLPLHGGVTGAYVYLFHVAEALGLYDDAKLLAKRADSIRSEGIRLSASSAGDLGNLCLSADTETRYLISKAISQLTRTFLVQQKTIKPRPAVSADDPVEVLIEKLQTRTSDDHLTEASVEAARELGDIGDGRAFPWLVQLMKEVMDGYSAGKNSPAEMKFVDVAEAAAKKIQMRSRNEQNTAPVAAAPKIKTKSSNEQNNAPAASPPKTYPKSDSPFYSLKTSCTNCGTTISSSTFSTNKGLCDPCAKGPEIAERRRQMRMLQESKIAEGEKKHGVSTENEQSTSPSLLQGHETHQRKIYSEHPAQNISRGDPVRGNDIVCPACGRRLCSVSELRQRLGPFNATASVAGTFVLDCPYCGAATETYLNL